MLVCSYFFSYQNLIPGPRAVKTDGPVRLGPTLTGFGLYRVGPKSPVENWA